MAASVLIAASQPLLRLGIGAALAGESEFPVVGEVEAAGGVLEAVARARPDVLLLDAAFQADDPDLLTALATRHPGCRVLMLVDHTDEQCTVRSLLAAPPDHRPDARAICSLHDCCLSAMRHSAKGCLPKASSPRQLRDALHAVAAGELWAGPSLSAYLAELLTRPAEPPAAGRGLTTREIEVVALVVEGLSNRQIGQRLRLSEQTVKNHVARVMAKTRARNRVDLAMLAVRERLALPSTSPETPRAPAVAGARSRATRRRG
jgi:two-component system response regulator DevR